RDPKAERDLFEFAVMQIVKQLLRDRIVRDQNIGPAVLIVIVHRNAEALAWKFRETTLFANVAELPVSFVVIKNVGDRRKLIGMAIRAIARLPVAAVNVAEIPSEISGNNQIQPSVAIVIDEHRARGPSAARDASFVRDIGERPVAVIVIQNIAANSCYVKIGPAVVVVIARR